MTTPTDAAGVCDGFGHVDEGRDAVDAVVLSSVACEHVGRSVATPERVLSSDASSSVEVMSYCAFKHGARAGGYKNMYLTLIEDTNEIE